MGCAISAKSKWELREAENPSGPAAMWPREQAGHKPATDRQFTLKTALDPRRVSTQSPPIASTVAPASAPLRRPRRAAKRIGHAPAVWRTGTAHRHPTTTA